MHMMQMSGERLMYEICAAYTLARSHWGCCNKFCQALSLHLTMLWTTPLARTFSVPLASHNHQISSNLGSPKLLVEDRLNPVCSGVTLPGVTFHSGLALRTHHLTARSAKGKAVSCAWTLPVKLLLCSSAKTYVQSRMVRLNPPSPTSPRPPCPTLPCYMWHASPQYHLCPMHPPTARAYWHAA